MADNVNITPGTGDVVAADDIGGAKYQRIKLIHGADNTNDGDVSNANPFPTKLPADSSSTAGAPTPVTHTGVSQTLIASNPNRKGLYIHNNSTATVLYAFAASATNTAFTVRLTPQGSFIMPKPIYTGVISMLSSAVNGASIHTELT